MAISKSDLSESKFEWLKPRYLVIVFVIIIWMTVASIRIVPITYIHYDQYGNPSSNNVPVGDQSFIDVALKGFVWENTMEINSFNISTEFHADGLMCFIIAIFWIPLYIMLSWLNSKRLKSLNLEE